MAEHLPFRMKKLITVGGEEPDVWREMEARDRVGRPGGDLPPRAPSPSLWHLE